MKNEFIDKVKEMRVKQREYFRTRTNESLQQSKDLERLVDGMIREHESGAKQISLF